MSDVFISLGLGNVPLHTKPGWLQTSQATNGIFSNEVTSSPIITIALFSIRGCDSCIDRGYDHRH